jgi:hypothetical protein
MYSMKVSIHKLDNYPFGLDCTISERGFYSGTGEPIKEDEVETINERIEQHRLSFQKQLNEKVIIVIEEDARTKQVKLFGCD